MVDVEVIRGALGSGYGYSYGHGSGDGYGHGSGYGAGYGSGSGDGDSYGHGSGSGDGYGSGDGSYWLAAIPFLTREWPESERERLRLLTASAIPLAFWRSNTNGQPSNGGRSLQAAAPGVIHRTTGPLNLCKAGTLHATRVPTKWDGERIWIVALHGEVIGDDEKLGCLEREIIGEWKR